MPFPHFWRVLLQARIKLFVLAFLLHRMTDNLACEPFHSVVLYASVGLSEPGWSYGSPQSLLGRVKEPGCLMAQSTYPEMVGISSLACSPQLGTAGVTAPCFTLWRLLQSSTCLRRADSIESLPSLSTKFLCSRKSRITCFRTDAASHGLVLLVAAASRNLRKNANSTLNTCLNISNIFFLALRLCKP